MTWNRSSSEPESSSTLFDHCNALCALKRLHAYFFVWILYLEKTLISRLTNFFISTEIIVVFSLFFKLLNFLRTF